MCAASVRFPRARLRTSVALFLAGAVASAVVTLGVVSIREHAPGPDSLEPLPLLLTNERYIRDVRTVAIDVTRPTEMFTFVFAQLPGTVRIYPTGNYYYFHFFSQGREVVGSLQLDVDERERGFVSFSTASLIDHPESREELGFSSVRFGPADGVRVVKRDALRYAVTYRGETVEFLLHDVPQSPPAGLRFVGGEAFVARTFDESGFQFTLVFDERVSSFRFVLDETVPLPDVLEHRGPNLLVGRRSGFAFYIDEERNRKILIGVNQAHVRRNSWYDGPGDQLPDNFISGDRFQGLLEQAYPSVRGRIDLRGKSIGPGGERLGGRTPVTPYQEYTNFDDLRRTIDTCRKTMGTESEILSCLTSEKDPYQNR